MLKEIINKEENIVIIDYQEKYYNEYYKDLKNKGYNIITINLKNLDKSDSWNPLDYSHKYIAKESYSASSQIYSLGDIIYTDKNDNDPFWSATAKDLFSGLVLSQINDKTITLNEIYEMMNNLDKLPIKEEDKFRLPYVLMSYTLKAPKNTKEGIISMAKQKLGLYIKNEQLSKLLSNTSYNLNLNEKTAIFIIPNEEKDYIDKLISLYISEIFNYLIKEDHIPINIILNNYKNLNIDEFKNLTNIKLTN